MLFATFLFAFAASTLVRPAPAQPLDPATLLRNGQEAQRQNLLFQSLREGGPCTAGDKACIAGAVASCESGTWETARGRCAKSQDCFALPSTRDIGTLVTCTSQQKAISAIEATSATGGIFGNTNGNSTVGADEENDDDNCDVTSTPIATSTATFQPTAEAVTVTVTLTPTTLPPETRTLSPEEASSLLASLMAGGATIIDSPSPTTSC